MKDKVVYTIILTATSLLLICIFIFKLVFSDISASVFSIPLRLNSEVSIMNANTRLAGKFIAPENNLGIIGISGNIFERSNIDNFLFFELKDESGNLIHAQRIPQNDFYYIQPFLIGFPEVVDSKGKKFVFELSYESKHKKLFSNKDVAIQTKYKFRPNEIWKNQPKTFSYLKYKFLFALRYTDIHILFVIAAGLLIFHVYIRNRPKQLRYLISFITHNKFACLLYISIFIDVFLLSSEVLCSSIAIGIFMVLLYLVKKKTLKFKFFLQNSFFFIVLQTLLLTLNQSIYADKAASWFIIYFIFAIFTKK